MPIYKYIAKDKDANTITETLESPDEASLINILKGKELIIISIKEQSKGPQLNFDIFAIMKKKITMDDLAIFSRQLATIVDAGIPLVGALDILAQQMEKKFFKSILYKLRDDIETGNSLSKALSKYPQVFSGLFISMIVAGEGSGNLDEVLDRLATYYEKTSALHKKIKSALIYPAVVSIMAFLITFLLLVKVVPVFKKIFEGFGAKLPTPTLILINTSDFIQKYFMLIVCVVILVMIGLSRYVKTPKGRFQLDTLKLKVPIFGKLVREVAISRFTRTLATLVRSGVPILTSLEIVGKTSGNLVIEIAVNNVRLSIREGESIAEPLLKSGVFPPMVVRMISVGEQSGELEKMLGKISDFFEEEVSSAISGLTSLIEPLIIAFLGIVIGSIVIAMFMPIFKLSQIVTM